MCEGFLVGAGGFEPPKSATTDLQSAPFGHSGTLPYLVYASIQDGAGRRTRTPDLLITNQLLYRLSYTSESCPTAEPILTDKEHFVNTFFCFSRREIFASIILPPSAANHLILHAVRTGNRLWRGVLGVQRQQHLHRLSEHFCPSGTGVLPRDPREGEKL